MPLHRLIRRMYPVAKSQGRRQLRERYRHLSTYCPTLDEPACQTLSPTVTPGSRVTVA